jgi:hypothetical protein
MDLRNLYLITFAHYPIRCLSAPDDNSVRVKRINVLWGKNDLSSDHIGVSPNNIAACRGMSFHYLENSRKLGLLIEKNRGIKHEAVLLRRSLPACIGGECLGGIL